ncbi:sigma-70 family RNA polymerase sigma factor [Thermovibrio sp.]
MYAKTKKDLVLEHLPLVKKVASRIYKRIPPGIIEFDELVNTGVIGLMKAIDNYDSKKARFSTYAYIKVRGEILDYLRKLDFLPRSVREKVKNGEWEGVKEEAVFFISLEEKLFSSPDSPSFKDLLSSDLPTPEQELLLKDLKEKLVEAIDKLSDREKLVLQLLFVEELDLKSVAEILNISVSRVSQIKGGALKKLRVLLSV